MPSARELPWLLPNNTAAHFSRSTITTIIHQVVLPQQILHIVENCLRDYE